MSVSRFKGFVIVHLRQYYYKEQERKPGKGVTLTPADLDKLEDYFDDIDADLHRLSSEQGDFAKKVCIHLLSIFSVYFRILH